jgi:hypothetical protein
VISHPGHPERGRVYITLAGGEASHARTVWEYLGHVEGYGPDREPDDGPRVDADLITKILTQPEGAVTHDDSQWFACRTRHEYGRALFPTVTVQNK